MEKTCKYQGSLKENKNYMGSITNNLKDTDGKQKEEKWLENLTLIRLTGGKRSMGIANLTSLSE